MGSGSVERDTLDLEAEIVYLHALEDRSHATQDWKVVHVDIQSFEIVLDWCRGPSDEDQNRVRHEDREDDRAQSVCSALGKDALDAR